MYVVKMSLLHAHFTRTPKLPRTDPILIFWALARRKKPKPVKNTENVQGANKKEEEGAAAMSYASLSDGNASNIYEHIPENFERAYDVPYEGFSHYEPSPVCGRDSAATVTINGVAVR